MWRVSIQDPVANIHDPVASICKIPMGEVGQWFFSFFFFFASCLWAESHLNMFVIQKNLRDGLVQNPPLGFSSRGAAECQAPSTKCTICAVSSASSLAGDYCFSMAGCFYLLKQNNQE